LPESLREIAVDEFAWRETLAELHNYALCRSETSISSDHVGNGMQTIRNLQLHRLNQAVMRAKQKELGRNALLLVRAAFPFDADFPEHWPRCRTLQAHVYHLQQVYQASWQQVQPLSYLLGQLALYLKYGTGLYQQAMELEHADLALCQQELGEEHPHTLTTMHNLAMSLSQLADAAAARDLQEQVLTVRRRMLGEEHPDTLATMHNLATSLKQLGDAAAARDLQQKVLATHIRLLGDEHPDTLTTMANLASSLWQLGDTAAARGLQEQVLAFRIRLLGEEHPHTLSTMNNLANSLFKFGDYPAAQTLMERALRGLIRILGEEHPNTQICKRSLAIIISAQSLPQGDAP
jgi:tetratricopeptide (TPR) repeat protein